MKNPYFSIPLLAAALAFGSTTTAQSVKPINTKPMERIQKMAPAARNISNGIVSRGGADDCASATVLVSGVDCVPTAFSTAAATQDQDPILCNGFTSPDALDVYFQFVATSETQAITVNGFEGADAVMELLEGDCGSLVSLSCADETFPLAADETTTEEILLGGLTIGTTYYVRVYDYAHGSDLHNFDICVTEGFIAPPPANDLCEDVTPVDLAIGASVSFNGDNTGATDTEGLGEPNVWHAFTISECADVVIDYCGTSPAFGNGFTALFIGCPNTDDITASDFDDTTCPDGNFSLFYNTLPAGTYYYAVMLDAANGAEGAYTLNVTANTPVIPCPDVPANDQCGDATMLISGTDCVATPFTTAGALQDLAPIACNGFTSPDAKDVYFTFVATSETQTITVNGFDAADAVVELFEGECGSLTSLGCADDTFPQAADETTTEELTQGGLTVGTTYTVRVYDYAHSSELHNFDICVTEAVTVDPPANDQCGGAIMLTSAIECVATPFTTEAATQDLDPIECNAFTSPDALDVYFTFVATSMNHTITVNGFNAADAVVELFSGDCGSLTSLGCADDTFPLAADETTTEVLTPADLVIGTTYTVRVYDYAHGSDEHNFDICVTGDIIDGLAEMNEAAWTIFPNPSAGVFNIQYAGESGLGNVEVFDVAGRVVFNERVQLNNGTTRAFNINGVSAGSYTVRVTMNNVQTAQRLLVD
ncbi:MAG: T9SS type A sorting domain-containing protein [Flavobacteriales bacterium]